MGDLVRTQESWDPGMEGPGYDPLPSTRHTVLGPGMEEGEGLVRTQGSWDGGKRGPGHDPVVLGWRRAWSGPRVSALDTVHNLGHTASF